jgi:hypothetical protein
LLVSLVVPDACARGGRGGGRGGRAPQPTANPGGGGSRGSSRAREQQKKRTEQERREARLRAVEEARILYAKQERHRTWDAEAAARFETALKAILDALDR